MPTQFTIEDIQDANARAGYHFFDKSSCRFFRSRIGETVYQGPGGVYFVTSEQFRDGAHVAPRMYTVRRFDPETGGIQTVTDYNQLTRAAANGAAKRMAAS